MITALIFDLDGTLVQTERLKAISYARAAARLCPRKIAEAAVIEAFKDVVGLSRREVAETLVARFDLSEKAAAYRPERNLEPWQAYVEVRLEIYSEMLSDPRMILENQWPHSMSLLEAARTAGCKTGLATMSSREQAVRVLDVLGLSQSFDCFAAREDVERGKPDPEIYCLVSGCLGVPPDHCLVIEDSPAGVQAALAAGMQVVAVSTPFTRKRLHAAGRLPETRIVDDPAELIEVVQDIVGTGRI